MPTRRILLTLLMAAALAAQELPSEMPPDFAVATRTWDHTRR